MDNYRGRFAPSPSGPLHFGSLVAALGSWIDARFHHGQWFLRIEDIDPPREIAGAADEILFTLEKLGLFWDGQVSYQSANLHHYQDILQQLFDRGLAYRCTCTRKQIKNSGGIYKNRCREKQHSEAAQHSVRLKVTDPQTYFEDCFQGPYNVDIATASEDFILRRKDGLFAYMLAVVIDDQQQQITHVIRGADLLETTVQQLALFTTLNAIPPRYGHLPLAVNQQGAKLSKQSHTQAIWLDKNNDMVSDLLWQALFFLKQSPPQALRHESKESLLQWAVEHWNASAFTGCRQFFHQDI